MEKNISNNPYNNPQILFSWMAPLRPYKKSSPVIIRFYLALALLLSLVIFFLGDKILIIPIWAVLFLFYILTITPPPNIKNRITKFGIETGGVTARWQVLSHFYFIKRFDYQILVVVSRSPYFYHLYLVIPNNKIKKRVLEILSHHLIFQEKPRLTFTDRATNLLANLIPNDGEEVNHHQSDILERLKESSTLPSKHQGVIL